MRQTKWITVIVAVAIIAGGIWFWQQNKQIEPTKPILQEETVPTAKTSQELMDELLLNVNPNTKIENYKIFEEVKSPYSTKIAVLFGLDPDKTEDACCSEPVGIFINNEGVLGLEYDILKGALIHLYLNNVRWQDDKNVLYDFVIFDEGGKRATQKSIKAE